MKRSPENSANTSANRWRRHAIEGSKLHADRGVTFARRLTRTIPRQRSKPKASSHSLSLVVCVPKIADLGQLCYS